MMYIIDIFQVICSNNNPKIMCGKPVDEATKKNETNNNYVPTPAWKTGSFTNLNNLQQMHKLPSYCLLSTAISLHSCLGFGFQRPNIVMIIR